MGITYGDHLIDSGYYDITPEQEREAEDARYAASVTIDADAMRIAFEAAEASSRNGEIYRPEIVAAIRAYLTAGQVLMVPKAEFDKLYREADSLARSTDYDGRLCFMTAKHSFDEAMAGKRTAISKAVA